MAVNRPVYIFAGGGTGGHLFPALAVADELTALVPKARIVFACSDRDIDRRILLPTRHVVVAQPVRPMPRGPRGWIGFGRSLLAGARLAGDLVRDLRPAAVLGLGGFAAGPVVWAAASAGARTGLLSIDAVPGLANHLLAGRVDAVFTQFELTGRALGRRHGPKARLVGCPVRAGLLAGDRAEARKAFGLKARRKTLLVVAGSLGAASINLAVAEIRADLDELAGQWQVLHVAGPGKDEDARKAWQGAEIHAAVVEFCDRMDLAYAAADLVLCRAGAATVGELSAVGKPAVLMPYPHHRDRQQFHNAEPLALAGAAEVVADAGDPAANAGALRQSLMPILGDRDRLETMKAAAAKLERADAAERIARFLAG